MNSKKEVIDLTGDDDEFVTPPSSSHVHRARDPRSIQRVPHDSSIDPTSPRHPFYNTRVNLGQRPPVHVQSQSNSILHNHQAYNRQGPPSAYAMQSPIQFQASPKPPSTPRQPSREIPPPVSSPRNQFRRDDNKRACTFCVTQNQASSCDGGHPCSACFEPNPDGCEYQHEGVLSSFPDIVKRTHSHIQNSEQNFSRHAQSQTFGRSLPGTEMQSQPFRPIHGTQLSSARLSKAATSGTDVEKSPMDLDSSEPEDVLPPRPPPIDFEEVKTVLRQHEDKMRAHREYVLQPLLLQAKVDCKTAPGPHLTRQGPSPFAKLLAKKAEPAGASASDTTESMQMFVKTLRGTAPKRYVAMKIPIQRIPVDDNAPILPKYRSIGRLGTSFLTRNVHTLKYMPYFADDENYDSGEDEKGMELKQRYKSNDAELIKQRKCRELVFMWRPWVLDFIRDMSLSYLDILYFLVLDNNLKCKVCDTKPIRGGRRQATRLQEMLNSPGEEILRRAGWSSNALLEIAGIGIWHVLEDIPEIHDALRQSYSTETKEKSAGMCSICFLHDCLTHGAYFDADDDISDRDVLIDDSETESNIKQPAKLLPPNKINKHQCGIFCLEDSGGAYAPTMFKGRRADGSIGGVQNPSLRADAPTKFSNHSVCSQHCFWDVEKRKHYHQDHPDVKCSELSTTKRQIIHKLVNIYSNNQRAPCMISKMAKVPCMTVFYEAIALMKSVPHPSAPTINDDDDEESPLDQAGRKLSRIALGFDTSNSRKLDARKPFVPCSHTGPCLDCSCAHDSIHCEFFCGCDEDCKRRFQGCRCKGRLCFNDDRCECWANNRECDPWLCGSCGVVEVLDPNNKYRDDIREGRCTNNRIQLDLPARTIKAPSEVQGWGLYAGQDLDANTFIGEYKGEVISLKEGDRRGVVYHNIGQEYLFITNTEQEVDGSRFGNKTRFMNNSQLDRNINVLAKNLLSNGVQRVMFYTKRPVKAGEELLYNYNYPDHVVKHFWERGEKPVDKQGIVVTPVVKPPIKGRLMKSVAGKHDGEESTVRKEKRKRQREEEWLAENDGEDGDFFKGMAAVNASNRNHSSNESDYEASANGSTEESEMVTNAVSDEERDESDEDEAVFHPGQRRKRQIFASDRRRGGSAQRRAWETRRKNGNV